MAALRVILGDQLSLAISSLKDANKRTDVVLMAEVKEEATYVKHHKKKLVFVFSAMRHFAQLLRDEGYQVIYRHYDDEDNQKSILGEIKHSLANHHYDKVVICEPGEYRLLKSIQQWESVLQRPVEMTADDRFIATTDDFAQWAEGKKQFRMEYFYREMRKKTGVLMEGSDPCGGKWNYDAQNRDPLPAQVTPSKPMTFAPDTITQDVIELVKNTFPHHFGDLDGFHYGVTRKQALAVLANFIDERLENFGQYQDAMRQGDVWLFHSHLSFYLNSGLLNPREVINAAEQQYWQGKAPLHSVEGFIRQILGWREYVRGFYWYFMPSLANTNFFGVTRNLPEWFWTGHSNMNCLRQCITDTRKHAYAHHIQRLMVIGNFCLLAGLEPEQVNQWYLLVYADAYEWVEMPNVQGMILYADGGKLASKPYVASGSYINKMSDYCKNCGYKVTKKTGEDACPFNYLYWHFLAQNKENLKDNHRLGMIYNTYNKMSEEKQDDIYRSAVAFLEKL